METETKTETIKVRIHCSQRMRFDQTVEMTREQWEEFKKTPERQMEDGSMSPIGGWLDTRDILDWDDYDDIEIDVLDENEKVLESYEGGEKEEED